MKLEKAIEEFEKGITHHELGPVHISVLAAQLGIEALKREDKRRGFAIPDTVDLLPGETKE